MYEGESNENLKTLNQPLTEMSNRNISWG